MDLRRVIVCLRPVGLVVLTALILCGCATPALDSARHHFYAGKYDKANETLDSAKVPENNQVLFLMERGTDPAVCGPLRDQRQGLHRRVRPTGEAGNLQCLQGHGELGGERHRPGLPRHALRTDAPSRVHCQGSPGHGELGQRRRRGATHHQVPGSLGARETTRRTLIRDTWPVFASR